MESAAISIHITLPFHDLGLSKNIPASTYIMFCFFPSLSDQRGEDSGESSPRHGVCTEVTSVDSAHRSHLHTHLHVFPKL